MTSEPGPATITGLHHVGHVVRDMQAARALYGRLGFDVPPATFPALPREPGGPPRAFGAGNAHAELRHNFVELATVIGDDHRDQSGEDVRLHPLEAPSEVLARLTRTIAETAGRLRAALDRFEGLHILAFHAPDADVAAARLTAAGIRHGGVHRLGRRVQTAHGVRTEPVGYLELDDPGRTPEGRLAVAERAPGPSSDAPEHPNGALALVQAVLCVPDAELASYEDRYRGYLGRPARTDAATRVFDLDAARVVLVGESDLGSILPGERPHSLPAFVAYTVAVRDLADTREYLRKNDVPFRHAEDHIVVPSTAALGCAVVFRQHRT